MVNPSLPTQIPSIRDKELALNIRALKASTTSVNKK